MKLLRKPPYVGILNDGSQRIRFVCKLPSGHYVVRVSELALNYVVAVRRDLDWWVRRWCCTREDAERWKAWAEAAFEPGVYSEVAIFPCEKTRSSH